MKEMRQGEMHDIEIPVQNLPDIRTSVTGKILRKVPRFFFYFIYRILYGYPVGKFQKRVLIARGNSSTAYDSHFQLLHFLSFSSIRTAVRSKPLS